MMIKVPRSLLGRISKTIVLSHCILNRTLADEKQVVSDSHCSKIINMGAIPSLQCTLTKCIWLTLLPSLVMGS